MEKIISDTIDNGEIQNVHLAPIGDFQGSSADGSAIDEHITKESLEALAEKMNSSDEVLCDIDHQSCKPGVGKDTSAAGWFYKFVVDPVKGLFANLKLTKKGKEILENREYRYTSPTFMLDENGQPVDLHSVALTNLPAFKGFLNPILNQEADDLQSKKEITDMDKEELKAFIIDVISEMKAAEEKAEVAEEIKEEIAENACEEAKVEEKPVENACEETAEEKPAENACKNEEKAEVEPVEDKPVEQEIIKIETLNSAPVPAIDIEPEWKKLSGKDFINYINSGRYR